MLHSEAEQNERKKIVQMEKNSTNVTCPHSPDQPNQNFIKIKITCVSDLQ